MFHLHRLPTDLSFGGVHPTMAIPPAVTQGNAPSTTTTTTTLASPPASPPGGSSSPSLISSFPTSPPKAAPLSPSRIVTPSVNSALATYPVTIPSISTAPLSMFPTTLPTPTPPTITLPTQLPIATSPPAQTIIQALAASSSGNTEESMLAPENTPASFPSLQSTHTTSPHMTEDIPVRHSKRMPKPAILSRGPSRAIFGTPLHSLGSNMVPAGSMSSSPSAQQPKFIGTRASGLMDTSNSQSTSPLPSSPSSLPIKWKTVVSPAQQLAPSPTTQLTSENITCPEKPYTAFPFLKSIPKMYDEKTVQDDEPIKSWLDNINSTFEEVECSGRVPIMSDDSTTNNNTTTNTTTINPQQEDNNNHNTISADTHSTDIINNNSNIDPSISALATAYITNNDNIEHHNNDNILSNNNSILSINNSNINGMGDNIDDDLADKIHHNTNNINNNNSLVALPPNPKANAGFNNIINYTNIFTYNPSSSNNIYHHLLQHHEKDVGPKRGLPLDAEVPYGSEYFDIDLTQSPRRDAPRRMTKRLRLESLQAYMTPEQKEELKNKRKTSHESNLEGHQAFRVTKKRAPRKDFWHHCGGGGGGSGSGGGGAA